MAKSHLDYNTYTPELIAELRRLVADVPRAEGVKRLMKRLDISERNARRQYVKYVEGAAQAKHVVAPASAAQIMRDINQAYARPVPQSAPPAGRAIRRLYLDLETSPNIGMFWRAGFKLTITPESIIKERAIICAGYKWADEKEAHVLVWDKDQDDKKLLATLIGLIGQADEIVMHNGDRFDFPWVRTRALFHGLPPVPDVKTIDTLKWCRSKFYFNSNKLDYVAKYLGIGGKLKTEYGLWKDVVLNRDSAALKRMAEYCANDVLLLEKVWARLYDLIPVKTHVGVLAGGDKWVCPRTGSTDVYVSKTRVSAAGTVSYQMRSRASGGYYSISASAHEAYVLAKG